MFLETLIDLIASIKLLVLKRYHEGQLGSPSSSPNQSLETAFDQLVANKYSKDLIKLFKKKNFHYFIQINQLREIRTVLFKE